MHISPIYYDVNNKHSVSACKRNAIRENQNIDILKSSDAAGVKHSICHDRRERERARERERKKERVSVRERERERERDRPTDRQIDRQTDRDRGQAKEENLIY